MSAVSPTRCGSARFQTIVSASTSRVLPSERWVNQLSLVAVEDSSSVIGAILRQAGHLGLLTSSKIVRAQGARSARSEPRYRYGTSNGLSQVDLMDDMDYLDVEMEANYRVACRKVRAESMRSISSRTSIFGGVLQAGQTNLVCPPSPRLRRMNKDDCRVAPAGYPAGALSRTGRGHFDHPALPPEVSHVALIHSCTTIRGRGRG